MKLKNILLALFAIFTIGSVVSCDDDNDPTLLDSLQVSSSYVAINPEGGDVNITVTAKGDWTMDFEVEETHDSLSLEKGKVTYTIPVSQLELNDSKQNNTWFTVSQTSGTAGRSEIKFHADAATSARKVTIRIKCGDEYQQLIIAQILSSELPVSSFTDVINGTDGTIYRIQGTCTSIVNTTYGNWYIKDDAGNTIYIYGTNDFANQSFAVGDRVTVQGPRTLYGSTLELVDADIISVTKALLLTKHTSMSIGKEADAFKIAITQKGQDLTFTSECDWLTVNPNGYQVNADGDLVFTVIPTENTTGEIRKGTITFKSVKGKNSTILPIEVTQVFTTPVDGTVSTISDIVAQGQSKNAPEYYDVILKDAVVTYKNGSNIFVEDATGGVLLYDGSSSLSVGQTINGRVWGNGYAYNNLPEATSMNLYFAKVTSSVKGPDPMEVTLDELTKNFDKYVSRYVKIVDATVATAIDVNYAAVVSAGTITDGTNTLALTYQSSGSYTNAAQGYNKQKLYYYFNFAEGAKVSVVCIPTINKANKTLNIWDKSWIVKSE